MSERNLHLFCFTFHCNRRDAFKFSAASALVASGKKPMNVSYDETQLSGKKIRLGSVLSPISRTGVWMIRQSVLTVFQLGLGYGGSGLQGWADGV